MQQKLLDNALTLGADSYYEQSQHLIDEGQFGAPIILTPFNYRYGLIGGVEFTGNYSVENFSAYGNLSFQAAHGKDVESSQFNFAADDLAYIANNYIHLDHEERVSASGGRRYLWAGTRFSSDLLFGTGLRDDLFLADGYGHSQWRSHPELHAGQSGPESRVPPRRLGPADRAASMSSTCSTRPTRSAAAPASASSRRSGGRAAGCLPGWSGSFEHERPILVARCPLTPPYTPLPPAAGAPSSRCRLLFCCWHACPPASPAGVPSGSITSGVTTTAGSGSAATS